MTTFIPQFYCKRCNQPRSNDEVKGILESLVCTRCYGAVDINPATPQPVNPWGRPLVGLFDVQIHDGIEPGSVAVQGDREMEITSDELRQLLNAPAQPPAVTAQYVLVRGRDSGVHVGTLITHAGHGVTLSNTSRIWRWRGANTLNELSLHGPNRAQYTRISERVASNTILDAIEIIGIHATEAAFAPVWND